MSSYYLRQEKTGFNLGPYERNCKAHWVTPDDPMPDDFSFQLYPDDLDRLEWYIEDAMARVPLLGTAGISRVINGPIPYAPDGNPLIGPMPGVPNAFEACVFTFGIAQGGGAGKVLAEWITEGTRNGTCGPAIRAASPITPTATTASRRAWRSMATNTPCTSPGTAGRPRPTASCRRSMTRSRNWAARFGAYNGWERANWFAKPGDDTSEEATHTWGRSGPWEPRIREECEAVRDGVGVLDLPGFSRFHLSGRGAGRMAARPDHRRSSEGRPDELLAYFPDKRGRILTEMSSCATARTHFILITAATAQWHDCEWLSAQSARRRDAEGPDDGPVDADRHRPEIARPLRRGSRTPT